MIVSQKFSKSLYDSIGVCSCSTSGNALRTMSEPIVSSIPCGGLSPLKTVARGGTVATGLPTVELRLVLLRRLQQFQGRATLRNVYQRLGRPVQILYISRQMLVEYFLQETCSEYNPELFEVHFIPSCRTVNAATWSPSRRSSSQ